MKIVCFGDSLTEIGYGGCYFKELVKLMPEYELINAGVGGNTVINLLRRVDDASVLGDRCGKPSTRFVGISRTGAFGRHSKFSFYQKI